MHCLDHCFAIGCNTAFILYKKYFHHCFSASVKVLFVVLNSRYVGAAECIVAMKLYWYCCLD